VLRALIILLLLVGVGIQTLPLRVCAVEQALAGNSCHDDHHRPALHQGARLSIVDALDGHASTGGDSDPACRCELPKGGFDRQLRPDVPIDLLPTVLIPLDLGSACARAIILPAVDQPPNLAAKPVTLPLLI
jgi:hypothetical protein